MNLKFTSSFLKRYGQASLKCALAASFLLWQSCDSTDTEPANPYDYFPVEVGSYRVYSVQEDVYSAGGQVPVTKKWFEKDQIISLKPDSAGIKECLIARSMRNSTSDYWQKVKQYKAVLYPDKVVVNLDNEVTTPIVFPYDPKIEWNGYQYFGIDDNDPRADYLFHFEEMDKPFSVDTLHFPRTLKVSERTDTSFQAVYRLGYKYYASGVGLVMDEQTDLDYLQKDGEFVGYRVIGSGVRRIRKIIDFGK